MAKPERARIAVLGAGGMGMFHAETLMGMRDVELCAVSDPVTSAAESAAARFSLSPNTDPEAAAAAGYDGVVIATPDETHPHLALLALGGGSRVLCEKPLAADLPGAEAIVDHEVAAGVRRLQLGFMREYDPVHRELAEQVPLLGELQYLRCTHRNCNEVPRSAATVLVQSVIHDIHTVHWLSGAAVTRVDARATLQPGGLDHVALFLALDNGATATIEFSDRAYAYEVEVEATVSGGMVSAAQPSRTEIRSEGEIRTLVGSDWFARFAEAYRIEVRAWVSSLGGPEAVGPSAWDGLRAQLVTEAALTSIVSGEPQAVAPADRPALYR